MGIVVAGLALVAGVLGWWQWWMVRPMGFGPAGPAPDRTAFAAPWSDRPVILVGIGDSVTAGFGASPGHSYLETMITRVVESFPGGCQIFLANIYDPTDGIGDLPFAGLPAWQDAPAIHAEFNRLLAEAAERHPEVHLVDIYRPFLGHGIHCRQFWRDHYDHEDPHYWFHANLEDPNDRGYDALRRLFLREMVAVFSRPQGRSVDSERPAP